MSADNGIYIIRLKSMLDGYEHAYRIAHLFAIENILNDPHKVYGAFCESQVIHDFKQVITSANELEDNLRTEYGICIINQYKNDTWSDFVNTLSYHETNLGKFNDYSLH